MTLQLVYVFIQASNHLVSVGPYTHSFFYHCILCISTLIKWLDQFWTSKVENKGNGIFVRWKTVVFWPLPFNSYGESGHAFLIVGLWFNDSHKMEANICYFQESLQMYAFQSKYIFLLCFMWVFLLFGGIYIKELFAQTMCVRYSFYLGVTVRSFIFLLFF